MCTYQQLARLNEGYVIRCKQCQHYQVAYLKLVMSMTSQEFGKLLVEVQHTIQEAGFAKPGVGYMISMGKPGVHLYLTYAELNVFSNMLDTAESEVRALELIEQFGITV